MGSCLARHIFRGSGRLGGAGVGLAERCATGSAKYVSQSPPFTLLQVFAVQIFALRRALAGWCLLCTLYRHSRNHWKKLLKIFGDIFGRLGCREVSEREKVVFRTLVEGCSEELFKDLRTLSLRVFGTKFWKILKKICGNQSGK